MTLGPIASLGVGAKALADILFGWRSPVKVTLAADPGGVGLLNAHDVKPGYLSLVPEGVKFENAVAARIGLKVS